MDIKYPKGATPLDPDELEGLKYKHVTTRGELDHLEAGNIAEGQIWLQRYKGNDIISEGFVRELHKRLFGDVWTWAGTFRRTEKNIGVDPLQIGVRLRTVLDDASYWVEKATYEPIEMAVRFHHRLVYVHPFPNGNGRHARIMADSLLTKILSQEPIDWAGGYNLQDMNERREQYLHALRAGDGGDIAPLMKFVTTKD